MKEDEEEAGRRASKTDDDGSGHEHNNGDHMSCIEKTVPLGSARTTACRSICIFPGRTRHAQETKSLLTNNKSSNDDDG